ncbi:kinase non-catalytic C-lobe domain-containing protein 1 isoform X3 [Nycticebus coucang]|uniref:kinase non-catalytic C-lobe domain-containing protein 1 isoform X3 n=1 Tax=Nycticebus coucang TaxID=9470 RepID=UPI00234C2F9B|nr:kinase non-catalytic C-lobe domain-containing protein 1 isoform X3 [Nycticebus coucang]
MQARDPAAADLYEEDGRDLDFYDFEPLPTLPEDEENVSLADILSLRDSGLSEQEAWAVCLECSLSMRSVAHAAIFQTLCITPDTLAFNTSGNVCFMEQLSDDPEGAFVPPEFDVTGNTFEAHIYSLGATLKAALEYVAEPTLEPRLSRDLDVLLGQMQAEDPRDRPDLESIIALCQEKMQLASSCRLCRSLSAAGRRVLSIESFGALQDVGENAWRQRPAPRSTGPRRPPGDCGTDPEPLSPTPAGPEPETSPQPSTPTPLPPTSVRNSESHTREGLASLCLDTRGPLDEPDSDLRRGHLRKVQNVPRLLPDGPEASSLHLSVASGKNQLPTSELFPPDPGKIFTEVKSGPCSSRAQPTGRPWPKQDPTPQLDGDPSADCSRDKGPGGPGNSGWPEASHSGWELTEDRPAPCPINPREAGHEAWMPRGDKGTLERAGQLGATATEQWVSLQDLLWQLGRPLREYELWALCLACLGMLQTLPEHPAYLCLDSVLVAEDGAVLFGPPPADGSYDAFFLAPEVAEERLVTEKASVYCVAAILWTAAKFSVPRNHKLALPRRLKTLLLDMARCSALERPSIAEASKVCGSYLLQRGMDGRKVLAHLRASTCKVHQEEQSISLQKAFSVAEPKPSVVPTSESGPGFVTFSSSTRIAAVPRPIPCHPSCCDGATPLPASFTSEATHFRPIVLAQDTIVPRDQPALSSVPVEGPAERSSQPEGSSEGTHCSGAPSGDSLEAPGPEHQEMAPEPLRESVCPGFSLGNPHPPPLAPENLLEGALSVTSSSADPTPPLKPSVPPPQQGTNGQILPGSTSELKPCPPGPTIHLMGPRPGQEGHSPRHPPKPPRSKATERLGHEPEGPPPPSWGPTLARENPDSPRGSPAGGYDDNSPKRPQPTDCKLCLPSVDPSPFAKREACPSLQEATRLIQEEFAFDGYLDNGLEALIMGEYIFALKDLTFATFCGAISEKFCDLYWDEKLLQNLFKVVNGPALPSRRASEEAGSPEYRPSGGSPSSQTPSLQGLGKEKPAMARTGRAPSSAPTLPDLDSDELSQGNFEVGFRPQMSVRAERQQPEDSQPVGRASDAEAVVQMARPGEGGPVVSPGPAGFQSCSPGWSSAFYEADCFGADVHNYVKALERQMASGLSQLDAQVPELEQQLLIERRNYRKTLKFYQKLLQKEKRSKGSEVRAMLAKLRAQLEEMRAKVQFLGLVKKYLQVLYAERWGLEPCALPVIVNIAAAPCDTLDFSPLDESSSLIFYNVNKPPGGGRQRKARILQAGTPLGLMTYLYSSDAFLEGYVQQFLYTFRYFCTPHDFLHFLLDRISSALPRAHQDPTSTFTKIYKRSLCVLQAWLEDCYTVDFTRNTGLQGRLEDFISSKILPLDGSAEHLLGLLEMHMDRRAEGAPRGTDLEDLKEAEEDTRPFNALCKRLSEDGISRKVGALPGVKSFPWRLPRGNGLALPQHKERPYTIAAALPKPCFLEDFYGPCAKASEKGPYFLTEYSTHQLFSQLTLLQQELFQKCHPVHFLNSRALGVMDKSTAFPKSSSSESLLAKTCSLFLPNYIQDKYLLQLLRNADDITTWVAAEIVTSHTSKLQVNLLSKFLLIAKSCYEQRNFATAMQILGGLEHLAVRQSPAWRILPAKMAEILEELKAVEKHSQGGEPGPRVPGEPLRVQPRPQAPVVPQAEDRSLQWGRHLHLGSRQQDQLPPGLQRETLAQDPGQAAEDESHVPVAEQVGCGILNTN